MHKFGFRLDVHETTNICRPSKKKKKSGSDTHVAGGKIETNEMGRACSAYGRG